MNLPQQISQLDSIIRQQAGQHRQTFTVNTHLQHENVLADPNRLNRVLMNILSNAVKYTPTGGHIRFEVDELPRNEHYARYRFVVQDDGIGMSEAYQKSPFFDPFTREERSGTNKVQGTGLGMAITKNIVDLMGGSINVESTTGKGTRFEVVLEFPVDAEADTVPEAQVLPEEEEETSPLSGMKFLCAEDNAINAESSGNAAGSQWRKLHHLLQRSGNRGCLCQRKARRVRHDPDGCADAGDGRLGSHPPHPQR